MKFNTNLLQTLQTASEPLQIDYRADLADIKREIEDLKALIISLTVQIRHQGAINE